MKFNNTIFAAGIMILAVFTACTDGTSPAHTPTRPNGSTPVVVEPVVDTAVLFGPYLQNVQQNGMTIMWTAGDGAATTLDYGTSGAYGAQTTSSAIVTSGSGMEWWIHRATLTGLAAGTEYHYRIVTASGPSIDHTFTTAPAQAVDFSFGVWGDSQGMGAPISSYMTHMVDIEKVDLAITVGDIAENGDGMYMTRAMFLAHTAQIIGTRVPFYVAWGNHDGDTGTYLRGHVELPGKENYSFDYAGCHFICIDFYSSADEVVDFIAKDLASDTAKNAKFTFLFMHQAPWYELWQSGMGWVQDRVVPLLEKAGVAICFNGHMHAYARGYSNGVYYVTTGGGAADLEDPTDLTTDWPQMTVGGYSNRAPDILNSGVIHEYVAVKVSGNACTVRTMGFSPDGNFLGVIDAFSFTK